MSLNIWTQCGGKSSLRTYRGDVFRVVEAQHVISTRKLTDTVEEQELLESLIDRQKPPLPPRTEFQELIHPDNLVFKLAFLGNQPVYRLEGGPDQIGYLAELFIGDPGTGGKFSSNNSIMCLIHHSELNKRFLGDQAFIMFKI